MAWTLFERVEKFQDALAQEHRAGQEIALWFLQEGRGLFLLDTLSQDGWPPKWLKEAWNATQTVVRETVEFTWDLGKEAVAQYMLFQYRLPKDFTYGFMDGLGDTLTLKTWREDLSAFAEGAMGSTGGRLIKKIFQNNPVYKLLLSAALLASIEPFITNRVEKNRLKFKGRSIEYLRGRTTLDILKDVGLIFLGVKAEGELYEAVFKAAQNNPALAELWKEFSGAGRASGAPKDNLTSHSAETPARPPVSTHPNQSNTIAQNAIHDVRFGGGRTWNGEPLRTSRPPGGGSGGTSPAPTGRTPSGGHSGSSGAATTRALAGTTIVRHAPSSATSSTSGPLLATAPATQESTTQPMGFEALPETNEDPAFFILREETLEGALGIDATQWTLEEETLRGEHGRLVLKANGGSNPRKIWIVPESAGALDEYWAYQHHRTINRDRKEEDRVLVPITELWVVRAKGTGVPYLVALQEELGKKIDREISKRAERSLPPALAELDRALERPIARRWSDFRFEGLNAASDPLAYDRVYALNNRGLDDSRAFSLHSSIPYRIHGALADLTNERLRELLVRALNSKIAVNLLNDVPEE